MIYLHVYGLYHFFKEIFNNNKNAQ